MPGAAEGHGLHPGIPVAGHPLPGFFEALPREDSWQWMDVAAIFGQPIPRLRLNRQQKIIFRSESLSNPVVCQYLGTSFFPYLTYLFCDTTIAFTNYPPNGFKCQFILGGNIVFCKDANYVKK
jgi:hypothetical protein